MSVLQSNVNWLLAQARARLGDPYVYGGAYSEFDTSQGCDCSGAGGWALQALTAGPAGVTWSHIVSTESWPYDYSTNSAAAPGTMGPFGTVAVASLDDIPADAALTVNIMHGGGGEYSHMNVVVPLPGSAPYEGVIVESNGDYGSCTNGTGAYTASDPIWTDHWFLPGPWVFDVAPDQGGPPKPSAGSTYRVQSGDTLSSIALRFGVTLGALEAVNPDITDPSLIDVGQVINIPSALQLKTHLFKVLASPQRPGQIRYQEGAVAVALPDGKGGVAWKVCDEKTGKVRSARRLAHIDHWKVLR